MFRRLDQRYGDPIRLTDSVIDQLKRLKPIPEGNAVKFMETVEVIERCWTDMQRNKLEEQMSTVSIISLIERILPPQQKREWSKIYQSLSNKVQAYPELMKYLKEEWELLDYMEKEVRNNSRVTKAVFHGVEVKEENSQVMKTLQKLQNQQAEHQANLESMLQKLTQAVITGGSVAVQHNQKCYTPNFCWYHNSDSHTINRCNTFHNLEPATKLDILKKNYVCFHCLGIGHSFKDCSQKRTCYVKLNNGNICGKPHHPKIHNLFHQNDSSEVSVNTNRSKSSTLLMIGQVN